MPAKQEPVCGRLTSSFLAEAFRPTPVSRERSTAVSPAGPRSEGSSRKRSTAVSQFTPRAKGASRKRSTAVPATEPRSTSMIAEPVAVIPLACGRHPSLPLVASDPRVWPGRCSVARALSRWMPDAFTSRRTETIQTHHVDCMTPRKKKLPKKVHTLDAVKILARLPHV